MRPPSADPGRNRFQVDGDGNLRHDGALVQSLGVLEMFARGLDEDADGLFFRCAGERCGIEVEDAPFVVRSLRAIRGDDGRVARVVGRLGMGIEEDLDLDTLRLDGRGVPYVAVRGGRFRARLSRAAHLALGDLAEAADGGAEIVIGDRRQRLAI